MYDYFQLIAKIYFKSMWRPNEIHIEIDSSWYFLRITKFLNLGFLAREYRMSYKCMASYKSFIDVTT